MNDYIREAGRLDDYHERPLVVTVDYDTVIIGATAMDPGFRLSVTEAEEFAGIFVAACWQAGRNAERMAMEASDGDPE